MLLRQFNIKVVFVLTCAFSMISGTCLAAHATIANYAAIWKATDDDIRKTAAVPQPNATEVDDLKTMISDRMENTMHIVEESPVKVLHWQEL